MANVVSVGYVPYMCSHALERLLTSGVIQSASFFFSKGGTSVATDSLDSCLKGGPHVIDIRSRSKEC